MKISYNSLHPLLRAPSPTPSGSAERGECIMNERVLNLGKINTNKFQVNCSGTMHSPSAVSLQNTHTHSHKHTNMKIHKHTLFCNSDPLLLQHAKAGIHPALSALLMRAAFQWQLAFSLSSSNEDRKSSKLLLPFQSRHPSISMGGCCCQGAGSVRAGG